MLDKRLAEQIYEKLKWEIIKGELVSNTSISERKFSEKYGISRTPLREALARLAMDGFVINIPGWGYIVAPITFKEVVDIFDVRMCIETFAVTKICDNKISVDCDLLREINHDYFEAGNTGNGEVYIIKNVNFHKVIVDAVDNAYVTNINNLTRDIVLRLAFASNRLKAVVTRDGYQEHERLIRYLESFNSQECIEELQAHLKKGQDRLLEASQHSYSYL
jgi:DNA-binding GntR family transcriptional regulator